jgi:protein-tyrosine-phosphatase/quercetin dioxygenase-like cupin family protein
MSRSHHLAAALVVAVAFASALGAQSDSPQRVEQKRADLSGAQGMEVIASTAEYKPGEAVGLHLHHGIEAAYVIQGATVQAPGKEPMTLATGATLFNLRDVRHAGFRVIGVTSLKLFTVHVVDKGRPLYDFVADVAAGSTVVFVCEHGNVKSLMAASYFNALAKARGLSWRAVARGTMPDADSAPAFVVERLLREGQDVSAFHTVRITADDARSAKRLVLIGTEPEAARESSAVERWADVPAASVDFDAARLAIVRHVETLLDALAAESGSR